MEYTFDICKRSDTGWVSGDVVGTVYAFEAKVYDDPSRFGIGGYSRVSKLRIADGWNNDVVVYERGWDVEPQTEEHVLLLDQLVAFLEALEILDDDGGDEEAVGGWW